MMSVLPVDPQLDLVFERQTKMKPEQIWKGWTDPETLMKWFCPKPWKVSECRIDLRPGGEFFTVMEGPNGERAENHGCFLEVVQDRKLVWTGMMLKGFRPAPVNPAGFHFVAHIHIDPTSDGTAYKAVVAHLTPEDRAKHQQMGFQEGWGMAFDQLVQLN